MPVVGSLTWSDSKAAAQTLVLGQSVAYHEASDMGGGVRHSVTATLLDQYGDPVAGAPIDFWSDANNGNREWRTQTEILLRHQFVRPTKLIALTGIVCETTSHRVVAMVPTTR